MGIGYKTAKPEFLDFMYELPKEAMLEAIGTQDQNIDDTLEGIEEAQRLLEIENMKGDNPLVNERFDFYNKQFDKMTDTILKDVLGYRKHGPKMRKMTRDLEMDLSRGLLGRAQQNLKQFEAYKKKVNASTDYDDERKRLLIATAEKRYNEEGLGYKDFNTYNEFDKYQISGFKGIDDDELITEIGKGFDPDQVTWSSSEQEGDYIRTKSGGYRTRKIAEIEDYTRKTLKSSGWEDDRRQGLELKKEMGEQNWSGDIETEMRRLKNEMIEKAKVKLGFIQEMPSRNVLSGDSTKGRARGVGPDIGEGRNNIGTLADMQKVARINSIVDRAINKHPDKNLGNFTSAADFVTAAFHPNKANNKSFHKGWKQLEDMRDSKNNLIFADIDDYISWVNLSNKEDEIYKPLGKNYEATYNSRDEATKVKGLYIKHSDGTRELIPGITSVSQLREENPNSRYAYQATTGTVPGKETYKDNGTNITTQQNVEILDKDDKPFPNTPAGRKRLQKNPDLEETAGKEIGKDPDYTSKDNWFKAQKGSLKYRYREEIVDETGSIRTTLTFVDKQQVYRREIIKDPATGAITYGPEEAVSLEIEMYPEDFNTSIYGEGTTEIFNPQG